MEFIPYFIETVYRLILIVHHHIFRYDRYYPKFLRQLRNKPMKMLEVGFLLGESYEMWSGYFPKGSVYFIDKGFSVSHWENVIPLTFLFFIVVNDVIIISR